MNYNVAKKHRRIFLVNCERMINTWLSENVAKMANQLFVQAV